MSDEKRTLLTVPQVAEMVGRGQQTIRNWTEEFRDYLSPTATINEGGNGRHRFYDQEDVAKLMMVREWRDSRFRPEEILIALQTPENWEPYLDAADEASFAMQVVDADNKRLEIELALTQRELNTALDEMERLKRLLDDASARKEENIRLQIQLEASNQHVSTLRQQLEAAARIYLEQLQSKDQQLQKLLNDMGQKREEIGRAKAIEEQLHQTQDNYRQYYDYAEHELSALRQAVANLQAKLFYYEQVSGQGEKPTARDESTAE